MANGTIGTGLGAPVGGAANNFAAPAAQTAAPAAGSFDFGSTLSSNLWMDAVGKILQGTGELMQGAAGGTNTTGTGSLGTGGYTPLANQPQTLTGGATTGGLTGLTQNMGGQGQAGDLGALMTKLNDLVNQLQTLAGQVPQTQGQANQAQAPAPAPAPQPPVDPVANLVNQANVDPQLRNAVTQVAQDPVGNKLLQGAVNGGLQGIQVANLPAGFFGQTIPEQKVVQIAPQTIGGNDLVRTVAHELTHAATLGNGDSLNEEKIADQLGTQVQQRQTGFGPGYTLGGNAYNGLPQDNGIANALKLLGITV